MPLNGMRVKGRKQIVVFLFQDFLSLTLDLLLGAPFSTHSLTSLTLFMKASDAILMDAVVYVLLAVVFSPNLVVASLILSEMMLMPISI